MLNPWIMKQFAEQRQNDLLKEVESYRIACQVEKGRSVHASSLSRMAAQLDRLLISKVKLIVNRGSASPTEASADA